MFWRYLQRERTRTRSPSYIKKVLQAETPLWFVMLMMLFLLFQLSSEDEQPAECSRLCGRPLHAITFRLCFVSSVLSVSCFDGVAKGLNNQFRILFFVGKSGMKKGPQWDSSGAKLRKRAQSAKEKPLFFNRKGPLLDEQSGPFLLVVFVMCCKPGGCKIEQKDCEFCLQFAWISTIFRRLFELPSAGAGTPLVDRGSPGRLSGR